MIFVAKYTFIFLLVFMYFFERNACGRRGNHMRISLEAFNLILHSGMFEAVSALRMFCFK